MHILTYLQVQYDLGCHHLPAFNNIQADKGRVQQLLLGDIAHNTHDRQYKQFIIK